MTMEPEIYRHKKTGYEYVALELGIDCTNSRDGLSVVIYHRCGYRIPLYVREMREFNEKFEPLPVSASSNEVSK